VEAICRALEVSRSGYYAWRKRRPSRRAQEDERVLEALTELHRRSRRTYGSPRMTRELQEQGYRCSENRIARIMRENGIRARTTRRFHFKRPRGEYYRAEGNLLQMRPAPKKANEVWVADLTYIKTGEGWFYLAAIMDLYSRKIVGWSTDGMRDTSLALKAFNRAWESRKEPAGLLFHTDQGIEFLNNAFKMRLKRCGVIQSTSRRGRCHDNAHMESFFHTLKSELLKFERLATRAQVRAMISEYIEVFYNRERRHSGLGFLSPEQYERKNKLR
jgi:putative transposase